MAKRTPTDVPRALGQYSAVPLAKAVEQFWRVLFPDQPDVTKSIETRVMDRLACKALLLEPDEARSTGPRIKWEDKPDPILREELGRAAIKVCAAANEAKLNKGDERLADARLYPGPARPSRSMDWPLPNPLAHYLSKITASEAERTCVAEHFGSAVATVGDENLALLKAALVDGRLRASGIDSARPLEGRKPIAPECFSGSAEILIDRSELLIGAPKIVQVEVWREAVVTDAEIKLALQDEAKRINRTLTQKQALEIMREKGGTQSRDVVRRMLKEVGGSDKPGPKGPRSKSRGKTA